MKTIPIFLALALVFCSCGEKSDKVSGQGSPKYPEGFKLISDAESKSWNVRSSGSLVQLTEISENLAQLGGNAASRAKAKLDAAREKQKFEDDRRAAKKALDAVRAYKGTPLEEEQIEAFLNRERLRRRISHLEAQMSEATAANDTLTVESIHGELEARKAELATAEDAWSAMSISDWRKLVPAD